MKTVSRNTAVQLSRATAKLLDAGYALSKIYDDNIPEVRNSVAQALEHSSDHIRSFAEVIRKGEDYRGYNKPRIRQDYSRPITPYQDAG